MDKKNNVKKDVFLFFDVDNTLFPTYEFSKTARKNAVRAMVMAGLEESERKLYKILMETVKEKGPNYNRHFNDVCKKIGVPKKDASKYIAAAVRAYHDTKAAIQPYPDAPKALLDLKMDGYTLCVATDGKTIKQWDKLIRMGIDMLFDQVFTSEEIGCKKSDMFYRRICKKIKANPKQCIMIGDREEMDIIPAKQVGWKAIYVKRGPYSTNKTIADGVVKNFYNIRMVIKNIINR